MTTGNTDIDTLASESTPLTLVSGTQITVERLRTRGLMSLLKILTRGAATAIPSLVVEEDTEPGKFAGQLLAAIVLALPEAEDEAVDFIQRMVSPVGMTSGRRLTKAQESANAELLDRLRDELEDPEPEDLVSIVERIIEVETPHMLALGKRLALLLQAQQKSVEAKQGSSSSRRSSKS